MDLQSQKRRYSASSSTCTCSSSSCAAQTASAAKHNLQVWVLPWCRLSLDNSIKYFAWEASAPWSFDFLRYSKWQLLNPWFLFAQGGFQEGWLTAYDYSSLKMLHFLDILPWIHLRSKSSKKSPRIKSVSKKLGFKINQFQDLFYVMVSNNFLFSPLFWGNNPIWGAYFLKWVGSTTNRNLGKTASTTHPTFWSPK